MSDKYVIYYSPPARWGLLDFMSVACSSSPPLLLISSSSPPRRPPPRCPPPRRPPRPTATRDPQCSLSDLNHDHPRPVFPAGPQPRPSPPVFPAGPQPRVSPPSVPCRTSTTTIHAQCSLPDLNHDHPRPVFPATTIHAQCSLPDLNREYPRQVFPAGPHVRRYGTKNVQKKVRKNVR